MTARPQSAIVNSTDGQLRKLSTMATSMFVLFVIATWLRFHTWEPKVFYGDDLFNYLLYHGDRFDSHWAKLFFADSGQKFRFVFSSAMRAEIFSFRKNIADYLIINKITHATSAVLFCFIAFRVSRSWTTAILLGIVGATSRFGLYEVTQITGQVESIALVFCLLTVLCIMTADDNQAPGNVRGSAWKWAALFFAFLAFNTHERYIVLLPWLAFFFLIPSYGGTLIQGLIFSFTSIAIVATNAAIKILVYHSNFFEGTGGVPLKINARTIFSQLSQAAFSIIGINHGPQYLVGAEWSDFSIPIKIFSVVLAGIILSLMLFALLRRDKSAKRTTTSWPLAILALAGLLIAPGTLTIRMEQRWELAPFFLTLIVVADGATKLAETKIGKRLAMSALVCLAISAAAVEVRVTESFPSLLVNERFAENVKQSVIASKSSAPGTPIIFVSEISNCVGTLIDGGFFIPDEGRFRPVYCVKSIQDVSPNDFPPNTRFYDSNSLGEVTDATVAWRFSSKR